MADNQFSSTVEALFKGMDNFVTTKTVVGEAVKMCIRDREKVCHYLDIPIQHASDRILKSMGRKTSREELKERIARLREEIPDIVLRTTLISGFPGETPQDHEELMEFVDEMEFDRLGVFAYSAEEDTPAALSLIHIYLRRLFYVIIRTDHDGIAGDTDLFFHLNTDGFQNNLRVHIVCNEEIVLHSPYAVARFVGDKLFTARF